MICRCPTLARYLGEELCAVADAMADGSYYQAPRDAFIELCGESSIYENWSGGEGE